MTRKSPTSAWRRSISSTKKTSETPGQAYNLRLRAGCGGCGCGHGCGGCGGPEAAAGRLRCRRLPREAAALEAAEAAALEAAAAVAGEAAAAAAAAAGAGAGAAAAACRGEVAASARLERLAITLTDASVMPGLTGSTRKDLVCSASQAVRRVSASGRRYETRARAERDARTDLMTGDHGKNVHTSITAKTFRSSRRISPSMCCRPMSCASIPRTGSSCFMASSIVRSPPR